MYENFQICFLIIFTIKKKIFTIKKPILGRKLGNLEWNDLGISSETTCPAFHSRLPGRFTRRYQGVSLEATQAVSLEIPRSDPSLAFC